MKKGQIWIETVIYTLIGISLIGLVLAIMTPKINEFRDGAIIDQTIESLNIFDSQINDVVSRGLGNVRTVEFNMKRGSLYFNTTGEYILFVLEDSRVIFSQPNVTVGLGRIDVTTIEGSKVHKVSLLMSYSHNLTFNRNDEIEKKFTPTSITYKFVIENKGFKSPGIVNVDIREIS